MPIEVTMPQMGESIVEGTLVRWLKKPGDSVRRDEPLFEISSDKVDTEVPSPGDGVLTEIKVREGQTVPVNSVVCVLSGAGAPAAAAQVPAAPKAPVAPAAAPKAVSPAPASASAPQRADVRAAPPSAPRPLAPPAVPAAASAPAAAGTGTVVALDEGGAHRSSPLVRKIAQEHGVDVSQVRGSGTGGRVTKKDILDHLAAQEAGAAGGGPAEPPGHVPAASAPAAGAPSAGAPATETAALGLADLGGAGPAAAAGGWNAAGVRVEPMTNMRAKIAEHMVHSKHTAAHVTTVHEVDMTQVAKARAARKDAFLQESGIKLTFLPFVLKAVIDGLKEWPIVNASISGKEIHYHRDIHLGIAVAIGDGLIVPIIRNAEEKSILGLARAVQDLAQRARTKRLTPTEVQGGTFTITNYGSFGSILATPVINQPQVAILGVGAAIKRPVVLPDSDAIAVRTMAFLSLSFDHRLIDGAVADQFMNVVKGSLERGPFPLS